MDGDDDDDDGDDGADNDHERSIGGIARQRFSWYLDGLRRQTTFRKKIDAQNDAIVFEAHFGKKMIP